MGKIIQTAGRNTLGEFAPEFAHFNDDVLFGENWNNQDIDVKTRSIITVVALMASGITDSSLKYHLQNAKNYGVTQKEIENSPCFWPSCIECNMCDHSSNLFLCHTIIFCILKMAKSMGCFQSCKGSVGNRRRRFAIQRGSDAGACKRDGISNW